MTDSTKTTDSADEKTAKRPGFFKRLRARLNKGDSWLTYDLANLLPGGKIDDDTIEELETRLLTADVGVDVTESIVGTLHKKVQRKELDDVQALIGALRESLVATLAPCQQPLEIPDDVRPFMILMVGVNGAGKTTTIGKLAQRFQDQGLKVMLAAGDTFRAAAVEQLQIWGKRHDVPVVAQQTGADPAAVVYDAFEAARARSRAIGSESSNGRIEGVVTAAPEVGAHCRGCPARTRRRPCCGACRSRAPTPRRRRRARATSAGRIAHRLPSACR